MTPKFRSWATLKPGSPLAHIFPDGIVPITPTYPFFDEGRAFLDLDGGQLTEPQLAAMADMALREGFAKDLSLGEVMAELKSAGALIDYRWIAEWEIENPEIDNTRIRLARQPKSKKSKPKKSKRKP
jgi:hypothetical protein